MERSPISKIITWLFYFLVLIGALIAGYTYKKELLFVVKTDAWKIKPCSFTTTYSIGTFDERFGVTKEEFLEDIEAATALWDAPLNKRMFQYRESGGDITVNLIYDKRQKTTDELEVVSSTISAGKKEYEIIKADYEPLLEQYEDRKSTLTARIAQYKSNTDSYNQTVAYWNARGGAPKEEFEKLDSEKRSLDQEATYLKNLQTELNSQIPLLNQKVREMNDVIAKYNLSIKTYNTVGAAIGKEFDEGEYEQSFGKRSISIYQFDNDNKLIRVLAHEFGHALGLDHVEDEEAIMYYLNESKNENLTEADIDALKAACRIN